MIKIFIGIPTRNRPYLVRETVQSVLGQTRGDYRVVVSDNESDAESSRAVEDFVLGLGDDRFTFHRQKQNVGEYGQGRYFFEESAGSDLFMILHDDDVLKPEYLAVAADALDEHPNAAFFVANPFAMDSEGRSSQEMTDKYLREHGRVGRGSGDIDVLSTHMACGFTPISGTLFRRSALEQAGFVDDDCFGNYPFESNIFLRLGECRAKGLFVSEELLGFRFHRRSLRFGLMDNRHAVDTMIRLYSKRRFTGADEQRRKAILGKVHRARALIALRMGDYGAARAHIARSVRENPRSVRSLGAIPLVYLAPWLLKKLLPELPEKTLPRDMSNPSFCDG